MQYVSSLLLLVSMAMLVCTPADEKVNNELERFQGTWQAVAFSNGDDGQVTEKELKDIQIAITANQFKLTGTGYTITGTFEIDSSKSPKTIDVLITSKHGRETRFLGIYEIQGDRRKSCFFLEGIERPTRFTSEKGYFG